MTSEAKYEAFPLVPITNGHPERAANKVSGSSSQIPFFVTACDYVLIGEEFYAASAYLSGSPEMIGSIKGQDYVKLLCMLFIGVVVLFSIFNYFGIFTFDMMTLFKIKSVDSYKK